MRLPALLTCGLLLAPAAWAGGQTTFTAPERLAIFGPEVARAVAAAVERNGGDLSAASAPTITGQIEELPGDQVRLRAVVGGKAQQVEGLLERVDELAAELGAKIVAQMPSTARKPIPPPVEKPGARPDPKAPRLDPPKAEPPKAEPPKVDPSKAEPPKAEPPKAEPPKAEPPKAEPPKAEPPKVEPPKVEPPKVEPRTEVDGPKPDMARARPVIALRPALGGGVVPGGGTGASPFGRLRVTPGRILVHRVALGSGCHDGATLGMHHVLDRWAIPFTETGVCGYKQPAFVAREAAQKGVHLVMMCWFDRLQIEAGPTGQMATGAFRVLVVRDGATVLDQPFEFARPVTTDDPQRVGFDIAYQSLMTIGSWLRQAATEGH